MSKLPPCWALRAAFLALNFAKADEYAGSPPPELDPLSDGGVIIVPSYWGIVPPAGPPAFGGGCVTWGGGPSTPYWFMKDEMSSLEGSSGGGGGGLAVNMLGFKARERGPGL